jgi:hypothetical protein
MGSPEKNYKIQHSTPIQPWAIRLIVWVPISSVVAPVSSLTLPALPRACGRYPATTRVPDSSVIAPFQVSNTTSTGVLCLRNAIGDSLFKFLNKVPMGLITPRRWREGCSIPTHVGDTARVSAVGIMCQHSHTHTGNTLDCVGFSFIDRCTLSSVLHNFH